MNTPSHLLITWAIKKGMNLNQKPVHGAAFLWGSVMPDLPLTVLTIGYAAYRQWIAPIDEFIFGPTYDALYFSNPWWIVGHNLFHSPLILAVLAVLGYWSMQNWPTQRGQKWGFALLWFAAGCGLHSFIDIFTHHNDGPLLFFPLNWQLRFISPVSYWDPNHYGTIFAPIELALDLAILAWMGRLWWQRKRAMATG